MGALRVLRQILLGPDILQRGLREETVAMAKGAVVDEELRKMGFRPVAWESDGITVEDAFLEEPRWRIVIEKTGTEVRVGSDELVGVAKMYRDRDRGN